MSIAIYDTPEYYLASQEKRGWAFTHPGRYISIEDLAKKYDIELSNLTATVLCNDGEHRKIDVVFKVVPSPDETKYKRLFTSIDGSAKKRTVYMIKGSKPTLKSAIFFTQEDFNESNDIKALLKKLQNAQKDYAEAHHEMLKSELRKSHAEAAKRAASELPAIVKKDGEEGVYDWFVSNKFKLGSLKAADFKNYVAKIKRDGHVSSSFELKSGSDNYGHSQGTSVEIEWDKKTFNVFGWSSDD